MKLNTSMKAYLLVALCLLAALAPTDAGFVGCCICYAGLTATCASGCAAICAGTVGAGCVPCVISACGSAAAVCNAVCASPTP